MSKGCSLAPESFKIETEGKPVYVVLEKGACAVVLSVSAYPYHNQPITGVIHCPNSKQQKGALTTLWNETLEGLKGYPSLKVKIYTPETDDSNAISTFNVLKKLIKTQEEMIKINPSSDGLILENSNSLKIENGKIEKNHLIPSNVKKHFSPLSYLFEQFKATIINR